MPGGTGSRSAPTARGGVVRERQAGPDGPRHEQRHSDADTSVPVTGRYATPVGFLAPGSVAYQVDGAEPHLLGHRLRVDHPGSPVSCGSRDHQDARWSASRRPTTPADRRLVLGGRHNRGGDRRGRPASGRSERSAPTGARRGRPVGDRRARRHRRRILDARTGELVAAFERRGTGELRQRGDLGEDGPTYWPSSTRAATGTSSGSALDGTAEIVDDLARRRRRPPVPLRRTSLNRRGRRRARRSPASRSRRAGRAARADGRAPPSPSRGRRPSPRCRCTARGAAPAPGSPRAAALLGQHPQPGVRGHAAADQDVLDALGGGGVDRLAGEHVADRLLERRGDVGDRHRLPRALAGLHPARDGGLETGEGEVEAVPLEVAPRGEPAREVDEHR